MEFKAHLAQLPIFAPRTDLPSRDDDVGRVLQHPTVKCVRSFALGPEGTNIAQASTRWINRLGLSNKSSMQLCASPEDAVDRAREYTSPGRIGVFWTCAVYYREKDIFFGNPDAIPFFSQQRMPLDTMQLAVPLRVVEDFARGVPRGLRIASHPSPSGLLRALDACVVSARSNAHAAELCAVGEVDACLTTETARARHGLHSIHIFGAPEMVFFAGLTESGAQLVGEIWADQMKQATSSGATRR